MTVTSTVHRPFVETAAGETSAGRTTVPVRTPADESEQRRSTSAIRRTDVFCAVGAAVAALSLTTLLHTQLLPFDGKVGFVVISYLAFFGFYALLASLESDGPAVRDRIAAALASSLAFLLLSVLVVVVVFTVWQGWRALPHLNFYVEDMSRTGPLDPLTKGGIAHAIVGTLLNTTIALLITIPLGVVTAVFLNELPGRFSRFVRTIVEAMTALPSIVAGLFIYATVILALGMGQSAFAAGLAVSVMMLPIVIRAGDVVLRLVPGNLREAALALGASQWRTVWYVVLPTTRSGLATAIILGTARGIGETSPVLLTAGGADSFNADPSNGWNSALPLYIFRTVNSPSAEFAIRAFGAGVALMVIVVLLFAVARVIGGRGPGVLTRRQTRRRARASAADLDRYTARAAGDASISNLLEQDARHG